MKISNKYSGALSPNRNWMRRLSTLGISIVLISSVLVTAIFSSRNTSRPPVDVNSLMPAAPPGWKLVKRRIADSPEMQRAVENTLNFNDAVFWEYLSGQSRVSIYLAYWSPGRMSHRLVAGHTPDVCWVNNGWSLMSSETKSMRMPPKLPQCPNYPPAESRDFKLNSNIEHVWFWHLVGGKAIHYSIPSRPPWYAVFSDLFEYGLKLREEQFFLRISSESPLSQENEVIQKLLISFFERGLLASE